MHVHAPTQFQNKQTQLSLAQFIKLVYLDGVNKKYDPTRDPSLTCSLAAAPLAH